MQKQTIHINFKETDMKDYAYAVAGKLNNLIDGNAQPVYDHAGIWFIKVEFNKISLKFNIALTEQYYYRICPELAANCIYEKIAKGVMKLAFKKED